MGYPGDQGKPGGWPAEEPSRVPYGPEAGYGAEATYGAGQDGREASPFGPPGGNDFPGPSQGNSFSGPSQGNGYSGPSQGNGPYGPPPGGEYSPSGGFGDDAYPGGYEEGPGMPGPGMDGPPGGPMPRGGKRNLPLIIGGAAVAGLLLVGGGVVLSSMLKDDEADAGKTSAGPKQSPTAQASPTPPVLEPVKLKSRTTDPSAMSLREAFGKAKFTTAGKKYVRTAVHIHRSCTGAVQGTKLKLAMKAGACTQVLRGTYARSDGLLVGTVGVFNLSTEAAAQDAKKAALAKAAFLEPLPGKGFSKTIGKGEALGTAEAYGHYLVMTWVQRPDGKKVVTKYHSVVSTFGQNLIRGSGLSFALHYRETEGKPYVN